MKKKIWILFGLIAPLIYLFALLIGSFLNPNFYTLFQTISATIRQGSPSKWFIDALFIAYSLFLILFSVGILKHKKDYGLKIDAELFLVMSILNLVLVAFPTLIGNVSMASIIHAFVAIALAVVIILTMVISCLAIYSLKFKIYSLISASAFAVLGLLTFSSFVITRIPTGLFERITMLVFLQWIFVFALRLYSKNKNIKSQKH